MERILGVVERVARLILYAAAVVLCFHASRLCSAAALYLWSLTQTIPRI